MLYMSLAQIIHQERQREIERTLERRRLLEQLPARTSSAVSTGASRILRRHERAGAAS
jgi:hypothetical protein